MKHLVKHLLTSLCFVAFFPVMATSASIYKFDRMFPVLQQPWYFVGPSGLAIDSKGFVYVADSAGHQVIKFTSDGFFINKFGTFGRNKEEFYQSKKIAIDKDDNIYVIDAVNRRIQKFDSDGKFISFFGEADLKQPYGIGIDKNSGYIYVANRSFNDGTVKKFKADGTFIQNLGPQGTGKGEFSGPTAIAIDRKGYVYITDNENHCVQKFSPDGVCSDKWGNGKSNEPGKFNAPEGIFVDNQNNIYVADTKNHRIQVLDMDGKPKKIWGDTTNISKYQDIISKNALLVPIIIALFQSSDVGMTTEEKLYTILQEEKNGSFNEPSDVTVDENGFIYVADSLNQRIQKFSSNGNFLSKWSSTSEQQGMIRIPVGIAMDDQHIYIVEGRNHRIQKFTKQGAFVDSWGIQGSGNREFEFPMGIAIDNKKEFLYITDFFNHRVQKITTKGVFVSQWGGEGGEIGKFRGPMGIAIDQNNNIYVTDTVNCRVQKFDSDGKTATAVIAPPSLSDNQKLTDAIMKLDLSVLVPLLMKVALCNDDIGCVITSAVDVIGISKTIELITEADLQMYMGIIGIAVDQDGNLYTANNSGYTIHSIQKFDANGNPMGMLKQRTYDADGKHDYFAPSFITIADDGFMYVSDAGYGKIDKINLSDPENIQSISNFGSDVGQLRNPVGISVDIDGKIYVADSGNNRIQVFEKWVDTGKKMKAIIVAGLGPRYQDGIVNGIWEATQMNANFAYRALRYQGFDKDSIYYLSSDIALDLDNDGSPDVNDYPTNANLKTAITEWAVKDADSLLVYFVDHGGNGFLRMNPMETLDASELDSWLTDAQQTIPGTVTYVYDACYSGSFLPVLKPKDDKKRIVISSASFNEDAWFMTDGSVSFSNYFWTHIFNGYKIKDAFDLSRNAIGYLPDLKKTRIQNPQIDDNGDGISDDKDGLLARITPIGNGTVNSANVPIIGSVSQEQTIDSVQTTSADITAKDIVSPDNNNIVHVWAVIRPPDYRQGSGNPVTDLPSVELQPIGDGVYKATYTEFKVPGTYQILVYARDDKANTSVPKQTAVIVQSPLRHKAIIVAGAVQTDKWWNVVEDSIRVAYNALKFQGYSDDNGNNDIALMSPVSIGGGVMPTLPTSDNLKNAISRLTGDNTRDVVIYLIGNSYNGIFKFNQTDCLSPTELNEWLGELQNRITGEVVIVYDACQAENFLRVLAPFSSGKRILIGSTSQGEAAYFLTEGRVSFSQFFWNRISSGVTVKDAFDTGRYAFDIGRSVSRPVFCKPQTPYLDDDGDGRWDSKNDGNIAENFRIGAGIMPGEEPLIVSGATLILTEDNPPLLKAKVISSGIIDSVWAIIDTCDLAASPDIPITELRPETKLIYNPDSGMYEGTVDKLWISSKCKITIYARNKEGKISLPAIPSPSVVSTIRIGSAPVNAASIDFTVTFSENVSGIDIGDFTLAKTGTATGIIASVSASSGKSVTVTVKNITGDGILGLNLVDNDSIVNDSGIALGGAGLNNGNFVGETCEVNIPTPPPPIQSGTAVFITSVSDITAISAKAFGTATGNGITERGFFWWNDEQYWGDNASGLLPASGSGTGDFSLSMMNLPVSTELYVSAYIKVGNQLITAGPGNFIRITTRGPAPPTVITKPDFTVNGNKILAKGEITDVGAFPVTIYGFVYAKHPSPTVWDMALPFTWDTSLPISQGKSFEGTIRNLSDGNYFFRAYAHNQNPYTGGNQNTVYGEEFGFTIGSVRGDLNGNGKLDLTDVILVLQVLSGSDTKIRSDYAGSETDVNGDIRMGLEEAIYILQKITELR